MGIGLITEALASSADLAGEDAAQNAMKHVGPLFVLHEQTSTSLHHFGVQRRDPSAWSFFQSRRASSRRRSVRVFDSSGAPARGRPESTKYFRSARQLLGIQWNLAVLG